MANTQIDRGDKEVEQHGSAHAGHPTAREYVRIFFILGVITSVEVVIYYVRDEMGRWFLPILFALMISKFTIVVLWYMHLKFDDRRYARFFVMGIAGATTLYLIVLISLNVFVD